MGEDNCFAGGGYDRAGLLRKDAAWISERLNEAATRFLPVWRDRHLIHLADEALPVLLTRTEAEALSGDDPPWVLLGLHGEGAMFAVDISHVDEPLGPEALGEQGEFVDIRDVGSLLGRAEAQLMAHARGLFYWHRRHRYCGACGAPTQSREAGHVRVCSHPDCGVHHFPRTDPAVIMLVVDGERCLLGRRAGRTGPMYTTLAGFVEPGETLEEAVAREVMEETGIRIAAARYAHSQPWPFPANLMLGFYADAASTEIRINPEELSDAQWFTRNEVADLMALRDRNEAETAGRPTLPRPVSIARRLIGDWLEGRAG